MNYGEYNINIGTETIIEGQGNKVKNIRYKFHRNGIPYKIVELCY